MFRRFAGLAVSSGASIDDENQKKIEAILSHLKDREKDDTWATLSAKDIRALLAYIRLLESRG